MKKNFIWMMSGQGVFSAMLWINMIVLAHLGGAKEVGYYSFALSIVTPIALLSNLSLRTIYVTDHSQKYSFGDYFILRLLSVPFACFAISFFGWLYSGNSTQGWLIFLLGMAKLAENMSDMAYAIPHKYENMERLVYSMMMRAVIGTFFLALVFFLTQSLIMACIFYTGVWWGVFFLYDQRQMVDPWKEIWQQRFLAHKGRMFSLAWLALPMGLTSFVNALANSAPRYFVEYFLGPEKLGYFASMAYFIVVGFMVIGALGQTLRPRLSKLYAQKNFTAFWRLTAIGSAISIFVGASFYVVTLLLGDLVLTLFYGVNFLVYADLFPLIALSSIPFYLGGMWGFVLSAMGYYRTIFIIGIIIMIATILACWYGIPLYGLKGAVLGLGVCGITSLLSLLPILWVTYKQR